MSTMWRGAVPERIEKISDLDGGCFVNNFDSACEQRLLGNVKMNWPKKQFSTFAVQEGFSLSKRAKYLLQRMVDTSSSSGFVFWATYDIGAGVYRSKSIEDSFEWLEREFIISPVSLAFIDSRIFMYVDDLLSFSIIFSESQSEHLITDIVGSADDMKSTFLSEVSSYYKNPDSIDLCWILNYVVPECSW